MSEEEENPIEEAKKLVENLKLLNEESRQLLMRKEKMEAERILSGKAEAGTQQPKPTRDEEVRARVNKMLEPTGKKI